MMIGSNATPSRSFTGADGILLCIRAVRSGDGDEIEGESRLTSENYDSGGAMAIQLVTLRTTPVLVSAVPRSEHK